MARGWSPLRKATCAAFVALLAATAGAQSSTLVSVYYHAADVNAACFSQASDRTTYVNTGDIDAMWLRDSSVQAMSYLRDRNLVPGHLNTDRAFSH